MLASICFLLTITTHPGESDTWRHPSGYVLSVRGDRLPVPAKEKASPDYDERMYEVAHIDLTRAGRKPKRIFTTDAGTVPMFLEWSPDGTRAYFIEQICWSANMNADGMPAYEVDLRSGKTRPLLDTRAEYGDIIMPFPRWIAHSPDCRRLAVVRGGGRYIAIDHRIQLISGRPRRFRWLTPRNNSAIDPVWFSDGRRMLFSAQPMTERDVQTRFGIHIIDATGRNMRRLTTAPAGFSDELPNLSADGKQFAFWRIGRDYAIRYRMNLDGTRLTRLEKRANFDSDSIRRPD